MANTRFLKLNRLENAGVAILNGSPVVFGVIGQWSNGSANVSRAAGNWIADGVKPWSLLSGNLATRFPGGTRVSLVGTTTLTMTNPASAGGSGTDSGTLTPTFTLDEDPLFPTSNLLFPKRFVPYHSSPAPASPVTLEFDFGTTVAMQYLAILCAKSLYPSAGNGISSATFHTATTYGTYTNQGTATLATPYRDRGIVLGGSVSPRFLKVVLQNDGIPFSLGGVWAGPLGLDLGFMWWPSTSVREEENVARASNGALDQYRFHRGGIRRVWRIALNGIPGSQLDAIRETFSKATRAPLLVDHNDLFWEVALAEDAHDWLYRFNDYFEQGLALESLR